MAKFTTPEALFEYVSDRQSVKITTGVPLRIYQGGTPSLGVAVPEKGHQFVVTNPYEEDGNLIEEYDGRIKLGTFTNNNRGDWVDINYNPSTLSAYLFGDKLNKETNLIRSKTGELVFVANKPVNAETGAPSPTYLFSIDALPFIIDSGNQDEIIHLDRYYDKNINPREYSLATEGKVKLYIYPRMEGRINETHYSYLDRPNFTGADPETNLGGTNRFTMYAKQGDNAEGPGGFYLFKLNWGDGSSVEHTSTPKLLEGSTLLEHTYEKPGFYKITGVVYASYKGEKVDSYETFQTNILLNPSRNYQLKLYDYENFAMIGGVSNESALVKTAANIVGLDPLLLSSGQEGLDITDRATTEVIENLNTLDKIQLLSFLSKVGGTGDGTILSNFDDLLRPYIGAVPRQQEGQYVQPLTPPTPNVYDYYIDTPTSRLKLIPQSEYGKITFVMTDPLMSGDDDDIFVTTSPFPEQSWETQIDWSTVYYEVQIRYLNYNPPDPYYDTTSEPYTRSDWLILGTYPYSEGTAPAIVFESGHQVHEDDLVGDFTNLWNDYFSYEARVKVWAYEPNTQQYIDGYWVYQDVEPVQALPPASETYKVNINIDIDVVGDYQSGDGFPTLNPAYPSGYPIFLNAENSERSIQASTDESWEFTGWELIGANNEAYIENANDTETTILLSEYNYGNLTEDVEMTLKAYYSYNGEDGDEAPPELEQVGLYLLPPVNTNNQQIDDAEYGFDGTDSVSITLSTQDDSTNASITAEDKQLIGVTLTDSTGADTTIQSGNNTDWRGLNWNLGGNNLTINSNRQTGGPIDIDIQAFMQNYDGSGGDGGDGACFLEGTMITMVDGKQLPIENIQVGMKVLSFNEKTNKITHNKVLEVFHHTIEETNAYLIINDKIKVTENHVMYVPNDRYTEDDGHIWLRADHIEVGDYLYDKELNKMKVTSIKKVNESVVTYNFEVENTHTYFAENVIVHNAGGGPGGGSGKGRRQTGGTVEDTQQQTGGAG